MSRRCRFRRTDGEVVSGQWYGSAKVGERHKSETEEWMLRLQKGDLDKALRMEKYYLVAMLVAGRQKRVFGRQQMITNCLLLFTRDVN